MLLIAAVVGGGHATAPVHDPGRLATYPVVYRVPAAYQRFGRYVVFFRTQGTFLERDSVGNSAPGNIALEDSDAGSDNFWGLAEGPAHCYGWTILDTPLLNGKHAGDKVQVTFKLRRTTTQRRRVTLRNAPAGLPHYRWYRHGSVDRALQWIGCSD
jgi:hypothetical protein